MTGGTAPARRFIWPHVLALLTLLGLWTWKLLEPTPVPEKLSGWLAGDWQFLLAKALHLGGYAFLTVLAVTLPVPDRRRWSCAALLALHAVATEIGQTYVPGRFGSVRDVLIDCAGIGLGVLVWRLCLREKKTSAR